VRQKLKNKIILLTLSVSFILLAITGNNHPINNDAQITESNQVDRTIKLSVPYQQIHIDNNWSAAQIAGICTGSGTYSDPYIIEDYEMDAGGSPTAICINIENTLKYFRIENCTLYNAGTNTASIRFANVSNGKIIGNMIINNNGNGITISNSENNTIFGNNIANNQDYGIILRDNSKNNLISKNNMSYNGLSGFTALYLLNSNNNSISENNIFNNTQDGIRLETSVNNTISKNNIINNNQNGIRLIVNSNNNSIIKNNASYNGYNGLVLSESSNNSVSENNFSYNDYGINLYYISQNNTIINNILQNNTRGIDIGDPTTNINNYNIVKENIFIENWEYGITVRSHNNKINNNSFYDNGLTSQALDNGTNNIWDNGSIGNYWHDYSGSDLNDDGIGDIPIFFLFLH